MLELSEARVESSVATTLLDIERRASEQASENTAFERELRFKLERRLASVSNELSRKVPAVELAEADYTALSGAVEAGVLDVERKELLLRLGACRPDLFRDLETVQSHLNGSLVTGSSCKMKVATEELGVSQMFRLPRLTRRHRLSIRAADALDSLQEIETQNSALKEELVATKARALLPL